MKRESAWYAVFSLICALGFAGRFWVVILYPDFWDVMWEMARYDFAQKSFSVFPIAYQMVESLWGMALLTFLGIFGCGMILFQKWRMWGLGIILFSFSVIAEAQYIIHHIGDVLFVGMLLSLIFGQKYKWLFIQILILLMWFLAGITKLIHGNWVFGDAMSFLLEDGAVTYNWMRDLLATNSIFLKGVSSLVPVIQFAIGGSMAVYLFTHNKQIRLWGCLILPALMCLSFLGTSVGLLPFKVILCSWAFFFDAPKIKLPPRKFWTLSIPIFYLTALLIMNVPFIRIGKRENYYFAPFTYVDKPYVSEMQYKKDWIDKSPWLLDRYTRFYATHKFFLRNNHLSD